MFGKNNEGNLYNIWKVTILNEYITIKNARIHNLKNIDVSIPKYKLTVITGVSGSGKNGKQIISSNYIAQAISSSDVNKGYGYLW